jgi:hypothetical protein
VSVVGEPCKKYKKKEKGSICKIIPFPIQSIHRNNKVIAMQVLNDGVKEFLDKVIAEVDKAALDSDIYHWKHLDEMTYHEAKTLIGNKIIQLYLDNVIDMTITEEQRTLKVVSYMTYMTVENFILQCELGSKS